PQQGRILLRVETLEAALGVGPTIGIPFGQRAPEFDLRDLANERISLTSLRSLGRPVILFFTNPHCGPCDALLPMVARWQSEQSNQITIAVISRDAVDLNRSKAARHGVRNVLVQRRREVVEAYQIESTPAAVLVNADGTVGSAIAYGPERIEA